MAKQKYNGQMTTGEPLAVKLMRAIAYDNGFFDRNHPEEYPKEWIDKIQPIALNFFGKHPELLTEKHIDNICCGEQEYVEKNYGSLEGFQELDKILDEYHDPGCTTDNIHDKE